MYLMAGGSRLGHCPPHGLVHPPLWGRPGPPTLVQVLCSDSARQAVLSERLPGGGLVLEEVARGWFRMDACHLRPEARVGGWLREPTGL